MKLWKSSILIGSLFVALMLFSVNVTAVSDGTNDVWYLKWSESGQQLAWEPYTTGKPALDITDISYSIQGTTATVTMTTVGTMSSSPGDDVVYTMHLKSGESAYYLIAYSNGQGNVMGMQGYAGYYANLEDPISGNTFTAIFEISDPNADFSVEGLNVESDFTGDRTDEGWWDYAPDSAAPYYLGGNGNGDGNDVNGNGNETQSKPGTPGFEVISVLVALSAAIIFLRRRK